MENGLFTVFKSYLSDVSSFVTDLGNDLNEIGKLPDSQFYYCFTQIDIKLCGARYKKDIAYTNIKTIYSTLKLFGSTSVSSLLPSLVRSTAMNVYSRQKVDALGP